MRAGELRLLPYEVLKRRWLDQPDCEEVTGDSGRAYQVEVEAFWDDPTNHARPLLCFLFGEWFFTDQYGAAPRSVYCHRTSTSRSKGLIRAHSRRSGRAQPPSTWQIRTVRKGQN